MTAIIKRNAKLPPYVRTLQNQTHTARGIYRILGLLPNGNLLGFDTTAQRLVSSADDGATWATYNNTVWAAGTTPTDFFEMPDGEIVVNVNESTATGAVFRSSGWTSNPTTATFARTLTTGRANVYFSPNYNGMSVSGSKVLCVEYGPQTNAGLAAAGRYAYLSLDAGATFTTVFDLVTMPLNGQARTVTTSEGMHTHGGVIDPWASDRLVVFSGDAGAGTTNAYAFTAYSDDKGATWKTVVGDYFNSNDPTIGGNQQAVSAIATQFGLFFLCDGTGNALTRIGRDADGNYTRRHVASHFSAANNLLWIGRRLWRDRRSEITGGPIFAIVAGVSATSPGHMKVSYDDGVTWFNLFRDTNVVAGGANYSGLDGVWGPTNTGKYVAAFTDTTRFASGSHMTFDLPWPDDGGVLRGMATVADGGTIAHGLALTGPSGANAVIPRWATVTPTVAGRTAAVTARDATNLTIALRDAAGAAVTVAEPVMWTASL